MGPGGQKVELKSVKSHVARRFGPRGGLRVAAPRVTGVSGPLIEGFSESFGSGFRSGDVEMLKSAGWI